MKGAAAGALELSGLVIVGLGLVQGLATGDIRRELAMLAAGAAVFTIGWLLMKRAPWRS